MTHMTHPSIFPVHARACAYTPNMEASVISVITLPFSVSVLTDCARAGDRALPRSPQFGMTSGCFSRSALVSSLRISGLRNASLNCPLPDFPSRQGFAIRGGMVWVGLAAFTEAEFAWR